MDGRLKCPSTFPAGGGRTFGFHGRETQGSLFNKNEKKKKLSAKKRDKICMKQKACYACPIFEQCLDDPSDIY